MWRSLIGFHDSQDLADDDDDDDVAAVGTSPLVRSSVSVCGPGRPAGARSARHVTG